MSTLFWSLVSSILLWICNTQIRVNRYKCTQESLDPRCSGIKFNDISGELDKILDSFEIEFLLEGGSMDTATWIYDNNYLNGGYQLFPVFGGPGQGADNAGIYKLWFNDTNDIEIEKLISGYYFTDIAVDFENAPDRIYAASVFHQAIEVYNFTSLQLINEYKRFKKESNDTLNTLFAGPDGLFADKKGNMYFTDIDLKVPLSVGIPPQIKSGGIFKINLLNNDEITLEHFGQYGYDGIDGNDDGIIVATNTVDIPIDEWEPFDNDIFNRTNIYIAQFKQESDGSLTELNRLFSIDDIEYQYFPTKPFLDGMTYDFNNNIWFATQINHTESRLSIINDNGQFLGEILLGNEFTIAAIYYAPDGYYYGGMVSIPLFRNGKFFRIPSININKNNKKNKKSRKTR